ncbi:GFA family protein [Aspergillus glaucus CBS 516.65]|uniref:CENP-V/GFA domain-containing protein n=1 Tax=Aspergillus glaucus CBS 516.65 TaxID=1160497 RepID=A0A1L9V5T6_ASPGL|nr:hypothetical protein ASPGLDRAFT_137350 [Aspergillus glaucus CBS 516.65]OJJ79239.1 hypothetical protein ASPGLDRAFT_137350 [Aspergillus glaucus CBS 516.65]
MATKDACGAAPGTHATHKPLPKEEAWKYRPPYLIQSPEDFGEIKWRGKCHCGHISYSLNMERPLKAKFCHCRGCQLMHGAPFQWAAIFPKSSITFDRGVRGLEFYCSSHYTREYEVPAKVSCSYCRTPIMDEGRNVCLLFPESIEFGKDEEDFDRVRGCFEVSSHIFYSKRMVEIPDGKPKWAGMDEASELLDDYGNVKPE